MVLEIENEQLFLMVVFFQSYWISLLAFKMPYIPIMLVIIVSSIGIYLLTYKWFYRGRTQIACRRFKPYKEFLIGTFLFSVRILYALAIILLYLDLIYILFGLYALSYIDSEINQIWCFNNLAKLFEEIINALVIQIYVLL